MRIVTLFVICVLPASSALAVKTARWTHTTEADFNQGTLEHVVATNLGDLKLSRQVKTFLGQDPRVSAVYCMTQAPDGTIYAGTGPEGVLLAVKDDKVTTAAQLPQQTNLVSVLTDSQGRLLVGTAGEKGEILRIDKSGAKPVSIFSHEDVQYIWAMTQSSDGTIYAATGPNGLLVQINPDGSNKILLDSDENNLISLCTDGKDELFVGTDPNGLVLRVNRKTGELFIVFDAPESEISALARDAQGNLYAATAEAVEEAEAEAAGAAEQTGRPEPESRAVPIPSQPPTTPKPPDVPKPAPGEPLPIPKDVVPKNMMILADPAVPTTGETAKPQPKPPIALPPRGERATSGNAVYRIDRDGFVSEIFRQQVSVFALLEQNGALLIATGNDGAVFQVNPAAEETSSLAKLDSKQVMCLLPAKDGRVFMGLANAAEVAAMEPGFAREGTFTSAVLDAKQVAAFGKMQMRGTLPGGSTLRVTTRSGNVEEASAPGWSRWSDPVSASQFVPVNSAPARFLQYRFIFASDGQTTPAVEEVNVAYQVSNLSPQIKSIKVEGAESDDAPQSKLTITWEGADPNEDELEYSLFFRAGRGGPWILMKDKLKETTYEWETRGVSDGRYEIKVQATDASANPVGQGKQTSRTSDPVFVDNTPPVIGDLKSQVDGVSAKLSLKVVDQTSAVARLEYSTDSSGTWQSVLPSDSIADSPEEAYELVVPGLSAGAHQIMLRATDSKGNRAFESVNVTVEK
jgi:outer membrane protein assembly factor BamB